MVRGRIWANSHLHAGIRSGVGLHNLVRAITTTVRSYEQLPCRLEGSSVGRAIASGSDSFCPLFRNDPRASREGATVCTFHLVLGVGHSFLHLG